MAIATLSLGCALGLSTAVFALMDGLTHPVSPIADVGRAFELRILGHAKLGPSRAEYEAAIAAVPGIANLATVRRDFTYVEAGQSSEQMYVASVRPGFLDLLRITPRIGRLPRPDETTASVALVSDDLWRTRFGNRDALDGATVTIDDRLYAVIGVMPYRGDEPTGTSVWIADARPGEGGIAGVFVRLGAEARVADVQRELDALFVRFRAQYATKYEPGWVSKLVSLRPDPLDLRDYHRAIIGAAVCVLLIACANVAALMLARGKVRARDFALRLALGASRSDIAREVLGEVVALAAVGSVAGAIVATWSVGLIAMNVPQELNWLGFVQPQWSWRVLALSAIAVFASVAVAGGWPAWRAARTDPLGPLKESSGGTTTRAARRFRWLVIGELSLTMMLITVATLMVKSAAQASSDRAGAGGDGLYDVMLSVPRKDSVPVADRDAWFNSALARVRQVPGVRGAALTSGCHLDRTVVLTTDRTIEGGSTLFLPSCTNIGTEYIRIRGWRIIDGRDFTEGDRTGNGALILDSIAATSLFPRERAVGRMIKLGDLKSSAPWLPVVGVVSMGRPSAWVRAMGSTSRVEILAALPALDNRVTLEAREEPGARGVELALARIASSTMRGHGYSSVWSLRESAEADIRIREFLALIFSLLGTASLALGAAGLFSVISYIAMQRMREFAIRVALGSTQPGLVRLVMRDGLVMALGGTAFGAFAGMKAGFLLWDRMYGDLYPVDAGALVTAEVVLLAVTLLACLGPALRASKANPIEVMRAI